MDYEQQNQRHSLVGIATFAIAMALGSSVLFLILMAVLQPLISIKYSALRMLHSGNGMIRMNMNNNIAALIDQMHGLEERVEAELETQRAFMNYELHKKKVVSKKKIREYHRNLRTGIFRFLSTSPFLTLLTAPLIYAMIVPIALLDICVTKYQKICFPSWGIRRVKRANYVVIDRHYLAYLNIIEKFNCVYCGYGNGNGVLAYANEVSSRTEQYWCPIKHARRVKDQHVNTRDFLEYGDGEAWRERLEDLRVCSRMGIPGQTA